MSALGHFRTHTRQQGRSLDDLVGAGKQRGRNAEPERGGGLEVDGQFELGGLLHRQVTRRCTIQNSLHKIGRPDEQRFQRDAVGYQAAESRVVGQIGKAWNESATI